MVLLPMAFRSVAGYAAGLEVKESLPVSGRMGLFYYQGRFGPGPLGIRLACMIISVGD
jgi:hypothetical protein